MTTGITMSSDFATNRFDRESVSALVQGGSLRRRDEGSVCSTLLDVAEEVNVKAAEPSLNLSFAHVSVPYVQQE